MAVKHRCFVSYHKVNSTAVKNFLEEFSDVFTAVKNFLEEFSDVFTAKTVGVTDEDDFINSEDSEYVMRRIREKYLSNTTVTIVLIGECTKARKYVDWEIASSLRNDPVNGRSGLLGINMKSASEVKGWRRHDSRITTTVRTRLGHTRSIEPIQAQRKSSATRYRRRLTGVERTHRSTHELSSSTTGNARDR